MLRLYARPPHLLRHPPKPVYYASRYATTSAQPSKTAEEKEALMQQRFNMMDMIERKGMPTGWSVSHSPFQLMDHYMPLKLSEIPGGRLSAIWKWIKGRTRNQFWNAYTLYSLAKQEPFLGIEDTPIPSRRWSLGLFSAASNGQRSWTLPLRLTVGNLYQAFNLAQAKGDMKTLSNLAEGQVFQSAKKRVKAMGANKTVLWNLHAAPSVQILSIRALESKIFNNSDDDDSMLAAQVLVKIDTLQSLHVFDKKSGKVLTRKGTPEAPLKVTEYLVMERRLLSSGNWYFRDQLYPGQELGSTGINDFV